MSDLETQSRAGVVLDAADIRRFDALEDLLARLDGRARPTAGNLWGAAQAFVLAALAARRAGPWLAIASTESEAETFADDLAAFGADALHFPARDRAAGGARPSSPGADAEAIRARLEVTQRLAGGPEERPRILVASILALLQPVPSIKDLEKEFVTLRVGDVLDAAKLLRHLVDLGYTRQPLCEVPGEVSLRGDILDLFPFASDLPLRVELFEDEIESLRTFDPKDQRSIDTTEKLQVCLASDAGADRDGEGVLAVQLLGDGAVACEVEPLRVEEMAETLRIRLPAHERALARFRRACARLGGLSLQSLPGDVPGLDSRSVQGLEVGMREAPSALRAATADDTRVLVLCQTAPEEERFSAVLAESGGVPGVETRLGSVSKGFRLPALGLVLVNHRELKGVVGVRRRAPARAQHHHAKAIQSFFELKRGDLVVHAVHGLARYRGLERVERGGGEEEHLHLLFAGDVSLFVPASRIDLVQRYIGTGAGVALDRIGGSAFKRRKERVQRGIFDLASELIEVQARRALQERDAWRGDDLLVRELVGSFPYTDTKDQAEVDAEIEKDLYGERPMDRLICGDVGFGKTELAVRAAFRVVNGGGQVALLVPTTVLAQQHYETFRERLADFPVEVAAVSRYVPAKEVREILERTAEGRVDILIGTHRILSKDVAFKRLGLVIVDEEQRFGVQHKEHFKKLRASVDLLTLTATPIPRTLHMSLSGIRDISALTIAPEGRQDIETILGYAEDDELVREAILREKSRGGQVYFLHNRVGSIGEVARRLQRLVPEASYAIGHGQMSGRELREVMETFVRGDVDVLVATTIIENGIDIPSAGTILIDDADRFGLSEMHQLRGRVGRGSHKAYCYLLVERHKPLSQIARDRLKALEEMNHLGAGFKISVKDLELRGAGNVLGAEQSGHIAAVGYDLYCRLLKLTVERMQAGEPVEQDTSFEEQLTAGAELELGVRAFLPAEWIPAADDRLELLRELAQIQDDEGASRAEESLRDRFGRVPEEALNLLRMFRLKAHLDPHAVRRVAYRGEFYLLEYADPVALERWLGPLGLELRRIRMGVAHLMLPEERRAAPDALDWLEELVRSGEPARACERGPAPRP